MRDEFSTSTKELTAKRVGSRCSNPECCRSTSGPQEDPTRTINIGVAAHITAASPGGPRFYESLTPEQRASPDNGIWLCQTCAKLVDSDQSRYSVSALRAWKSVAEGVAARDLERRSCLSTKPDATFRRTEQLMPALFAEMRKDLSVHPIRREVVVLKKGWVYSAKGNELAYYYDDHPELDSKLQVLQNLGLIVEITYNNVKRFTITEHFAEYLGAYDIS